MSDNLQLKQRRDRSLEGRLAKAKANYETLLAQLEAREKRRKAKLSKEERRQRNTYLIDLGIALSHLLLQMCEKSKEKWTAKALEGLEGKALAKRQNSLAWVFSQSCPQDVPIMQDNGEKPPGAICHAQPDPQITPY